eukprot:scaffold11484_cov36-Prasinocladus_malaysianus.AAC.1
MWHLDRKIIPIDTIEKTRSSSGLSELDGWRLSCIRAYVCRCLGTRLGQRASSSDVALLAAAMTSARVCRVQVCLGALYKMYTHKRWDVSRLDGLASSAALPALLRASYVQLPSS